MESSISAWSFDICKHSCIYIHTQDKQKTWENLHYKRMQLSSHKKVNLVMDGLSHKCVMSRDFFVWEKPHSLQVLLFKFGFWMASMGSSYDWLPFNNSNMLAFLTKEIKTLILAQVGMNMRLSQDAYRSIYSTDSFQKERERERNDLTF